MHGEQTDYRGFALRIAHRDDPRTLIWMGGVTIVFALVNHAAPPRTPTVELLGVLLIGSGMIVGGMIMRRPAFPEWLVPWVFASAVTVFVSWLLVIYVNEPIGSNLTYVLVATTAYGPLTLAWRPFLAAGAAILVATAYAMSAVGQERVIDWTIGIAASIAVSAVLLRLRLRLLRELADAERAITSLSTTDAQTRLLNRRGLEERIPALWADGRRRSEQISIWFLDVRGLKRANDEYGHEFGDTVIRDVAEAIRSSVRAGDLAARWGGDEFVIAGLGAPATADDLSSRIAEHLRVNRQARGDGWGGEVTVGLAVAPAYESRFEELLQLADNDMYARRLAG